jgi:hypothetical protein
MTSMNNTNVTINPEEATGAHGRMDLGAFASDFF